MKKMNLFQCFLLSALLTWVGCFSGSSGSKKNGDLSAPSDVTALTATSAVGQVTLQWTDPSDSDFSHVEIAWSPGGTASQTVAGGTGTYTASGLTNGVACVFIVKTVNISGNTSAGATVTATPRDVSGTWNITMVNAASSETFMDNWILTQSGNNVTFAYPIIDTYTFTAIGNRFSIDIPGASTWSGNISGNMITGTWSDQSGSGNGTFTMTRASDSTTVPLASIPVGTITVDGNAADWSSISPIISDAVGDGTLSGTAGSDIEWVKLAVNASKTKMYGLMKVASGNINQNFEYDFRFSASNFKKEISIHNYGPGWSISGWDVNSSQNITLTGSSVFAGGSYIEFAFDLSSVNLPSKFEVEVNIQTSGYIDVAATSTLTTSSIPVAAITVDGKSADWSSVSNIAADATGDNALNIIGSDIEYAKLALDASNTKLYALIKVSNGDISKSNGYQLNFAHPTNSSLFNKYFDIYWVNDSWSVSGWDNVTGQDIMVTGASAVPSGSYLEIVMDLSSINLPAQYKVNFNVNYWNDIDESDLLGFAVMP